MEIPTEFYETTKDLLKLYPHVNENSFSYDDMTNAISHINNDPYFDIFENRYFNKMKIEELSEHCNLSVTRVRYHIKRLTNEVVKVLYATEISENILKHKKGY